MEEGLLSIISVSSKLLNCVLVSWVKFCILIYFNIVQPLVCKMVTRLCNHVLNTTPEQFTYIVVYTLYLCSSDKNCTTLAQPWLIYIHHGSCTLQSIDCECYAICWGNMPGLDILILVKWGLSLQMKTVL